jgi:signal transduction histidine kinase
MALLAGVHREISDLLRDFPKMITPEVARLGVLGALKQTVQAEFGRSFDQVEWRFEPQAEVQVKRLVPLTAEVLYYAAREATRNAARHGRGNKDGEGALNLLITARCKTEGIEIMVEDNGVGLEATARDGTESEGDNGLNNGRHSGGQGLALHSTMMAVVGGTLSTESVPGAYTRVWLSLPLKEG